MPKLVEGTPSTTELGQPALAGSKEESAEVSEIIVQEKIESAEAFCRSHKKSGRSAGARRIGRITKNPEPSTRAGVAEGAKSSCNNSQEEEDG